MMELFSLASLATCGAVVFVASTIAAIATSKSTPRMARTNRRTA